jgi:hypothetical protein
VTRTIGTIGAGTTIRGKTSLQPTPSRVELEPTSAVEVGVEAEAAASAAAAAAAAATIATIVSGSEMVVEEKPVEKAE